MSSAELSSNRWLPQLNSVLTACLAAVPATAWTVTKIIRYVKSVLLVATLTHNCNQNASATRSWAANTSAQAQCRVSRSRGVPAV